MQIDLTPELDGFIEYAISKGLYSNREDAVHAALAMWEERARARLELIAAIEEGERSIEEDGGIVLETEEDIHKFFDEIVENGKARVAAAQKADLCA